MTANEQLTSQLQLMLNFQQVKRPGWSFRCNEDLVLQHGRVYQARKPPYHPIPKACYQRSYLFATRKGSPWIYVEGFAVKPSLGLAVSHAWLTREDDPEGAYDVAWEMEDHAYLGIAFSAAYVKRVFLASKRHFYSVLDAWWIDYPLLTGEHSLQDAIWRRP